MKIKMKTKKLVLFLSIVIATLILTNIKINKNQDLIWHLEENIHSKIIFTIKKIYIFYTHEIRSTIILEKNLTDKNVNSKEKNYKLNTFSNKVKGDGTYRNLNNVDKLFLSISILLFSKALIGLSSEEKRNPSLVKL